MDQVNFGMSLFIQSEETESRISTTLLAFGSYLVLTAFVSSVKSRLHLPTPLLSMLFGVVLGPSVLGVLSLGQWNDGKEDDENRQIMLSFCRVVLGIQILSAAITLPTKMLLRSRSAISLFTLLIPQIVTAWLISAAATYFSIPSIGWVESLVVGSTLAPTDPVLASSVIKGVFAERHVPERIRDLLLSESTLNDGAGTPFVYISLLLLIRSSSVISSGVESESTWELLKIWFVQIICYNIVGGIVFGLTCGTFCRQALMRSKKLGWLEKEDNLIFTLSLAMGVIGGGSLLGVNEMLACFFAGSSLNWQNYFHEEELNSHFTLGIDNLLDTVIFTFVGTILPFEVWLKSDVLPLGRLFLLAALILIFRRLPAVLLMKKGLPQLGSFRETAFVGWIGPIGIASLYYTLTCTEKIPQDHYLAFNLFPIVSFIIAASVIVHGITVPILMGTIHFVNPSLAPHLLPNGNENGAIEHDGSYGENASRNYRDDEED